MSFDQAKSKVGSVWEAAKQKMDDSINEVHEYRQYSGPAWTGRDGERYSEAQLRGTIEGVDPADAQALAAGRHAVMVDLHGENPRPDATKWSDISEGAKNYAEAAKDKVGDAAETAKDKFSGAWESTKETVAGAAQKVADKALDAKDAMAGIHRDSEGAAKIERHP